MDGFFYLVAQIALLLLAATVLAFLAGRYLWPGRPRGGARAFASTGDSAAGSLEQQLAVSQATIHELRTTVTTITDHKDAEMGRLESRAIQAMDTLIASHDARIGALQSLLDAANGSTRLQERELEAERRHSLRLQAAIVDRDERIAALTRELAECGQRVRQLDGSSGTAGVSAGDGATAADRRLVKRSLRRPPQPRLTSKEPDDDQSR